MTTDPEQDLTVHPAEDDTPFEWLDDDAGPVVRPYAVIGGRTRHTGQFDVLAFVATTDRAATSDRPADRDGDSRNLQPEHRRILERARDPVSVAELGAHLDLALGVLRVLLSDLLAEDLIVVHEPLDGATRPAENVLEAVIDGLRAL
jgi:hypothetical protein